jgi:hypothetical protein
MHSHSRGRIAPGNAGSLSLLLLKGAGKAGCPPHPWPPCVKKHGEGTAGEGGIIRPFLRQWFTAYFALWGPGLFAPTARVAHNATDLASASGGQDHTTSPSALMPIVFCINPSTAFWTQRP